MKKTTFLMVMGLATTAAFADPSWALLNTEGAQGETTDYTSRYTGYLCTVAEAETFFGGNSSTADITAYLGGSAANYASGMGALAGGGTALNAYGFDDGVYSFSAYFESGTIDGSYVAVLACAGIEGAETMFRVFDGQVGNNRLVFDPISGIGGAGAWTAAVPEPTSGMIFLIGLASLALRRKKCEV